MTIRGYALYHYRIPVDSQLVLRNRFLKVREGLIVRVQCGEKVGLGEIAPLPYFSLETLDEAKNEAITWLENWQRAKSKDEHLSLENCSPSVAFGLSCALAEMTGHLQETGNYHPTPLCYGDPDALYAKLSAMQGEKVAKMKVGLYEANRDGLIANMLLEAIPDLRLRLDANRSWSREKARQFAKYVAEGHRPRIQFLEEPCKTPEESLAFAKETGIAIAWDETTREKDFQPQANPAVSAIVIKPTLVGSIEKCVALIEQAQKQGLQAVISSSIESSLGLTQLARLSAQYTPHTLPGLDTLDFMAYQLVRPWQGSLLPVIQLDSDEFVTLVAEKNTQCPDF